MNTAKRFLAAAGALTLSLAAAYGATAAGPADFYQGKTVSFVIGGATGGGYDVYMRLLVQHIQKRLPGRPTALAVNMPGGGGIKAMNYVNNAAPKDGSYLVMPFFNHGVFQLIRPKGIKFDVRKMRWIGNMAELTSVLALYHKAPVTSIEAAKHKQLILATSSKASETYIYPTLMASLTGAKIKMVQGYRGTASMTVAMERGEVMGRGGSYMSWSALRPDWIRDGKVKFVLQAGLTRNPNIPDVPMLQDFAKTPEDKAVAELMSLPFLMSRVVGFPPGVPEDRVAAFRTAFDATMKSPALLAEAKKRRMAISPSTGQEVEAAIEKMFSAPPAVVERARKLLKY